MVTLSEKWSKMKFVLRYLQHQKLQKFGKTIFEGILKILKCVFTTAHNHEKEFAYFIFNYMIFVCFTAALITADTIFETIQNVDKFSNSNAVIPAEIHNRKELSCLTK